MKRSARLIFFGTEQFSTASLEALLHAGWSISAVVTKPDRARGRGQQIEAFPIKYLADQHNIPVLQPQKVAQATEQIASVLPTHGVLVSYGEIIPKPVLDLFPGGIINLHPSLLPLYRGPSPIEAAILNGDSQTGVTLMKLSEEMDAGPVYAKKSVILNSNEDQLTLSGKLAAIGAHFLIEKLHLITSGFLQPVAQDESKATYTKLLKKTDGKIDWSLPAEIIERQIRAYLRFPRSRARISGHEVVITKARVAASQADGALVKAAKPGWLEVLELIGPSGRKMSGADFLRGYGQLKRSEEK